MVPVLALSLTLGACARETNYCEGDHNYFLKSVLLGVLAQRLSVYQVGAVATQYSSA